MNRKELEQVIARAIAKEYTSDYGGRNPDWDINKPDGPDNLYYLVENMNSRVKQPPAKFMQVNGERIMSFPSCNEIASVVAEVLDDALIVD